MSPEDQGTGAVSVVRGAPWDFFPGQHPAAVRPRPHHASGLGRLPDRLASLGPYYGTLSCFDNTSDVRGRGRARVPRRHFRDPDHSGDSTGGYLVSFPIATLVGGSVAFTVSRERKLELLKSRSGVRLIAARNLHSRHALAHGVPAPDAAPSAPPGTVPFIGCDIVKAIVAAPIAVRLRSDRARPSCEQSSPGDELTPVERNLGG